MFYSLCSRTGWTPEQVEALTEYDYVHMVALLIIEGQQQ